MSKAKQIWAILFPNGFWFTYIPASFILCVQVALGVFDTFRGAPDWSILISCICITAGLRMIYKTYRYRASVREQQAFMSAVLNTVRPQLEALYKDSMKDGLNLNACIEEYEQVTKIIDAEVQRRKNLARVSKTGKP